MLIKPNKKQKFMELTYSSNHLRNLYTCFFIAFCELSFFIFSSYSLYKIDMIIILNKNKNKDKLDKWRLWYKQGINLGNCNT